VTWAIAETREPRSTDRGFRIGVGDLVDVKGLGTADPESLVGRRVGPQTYRHMLDCLLGVGGLALSREWVI
jgi:hypothetical protein